MVEICVYYIRKTPHLSMPVTGLLGLEKQGKVKLSFVFDPENRRRYPYPHLLGVYGGGKRVLFDLSDGYGSVERAARLHLVEQSDFLFCRSFSPEENRKLPEELRGRVRPLGFHFHVSCPGNPIDAVSSWGERKGDLFQRVFNGATRSWFTPEKFEKPPQRTEKPTVLFYTRLWNMPKESEIYNTVQQMNEDRIRLVAELKKRLGPQFTGGIQFDPKWAKRCGPLMEWGPATRRTRYLRTMRQADICIGSIGLHGSIGWKTAEYIAASKAIVNERFIYEVVGGFREGINYLPFTDVDGCLAQVERLLADPQAVYEMGLANQAYYQEYGRPDRMMENALHQVFPGWGGGQG